MTFSRKRNSRLWPRYYKSTGGLYLSRTDTSFAAEHLFDYLHSFMEIQNVHGLIVANLEIS